MISKEQLNTLKIGDSIYLYNIDFSSSGFKTLLETYPTRATIVDIVYSSSRCASLFRVKYIKNKKETISEYFGFDMEKEYAYYHGGRGVFMTEDECKEDCKKALLVEMERAKSDYDIRAEKINSLLEKIK